MCQNGATCVNGTYGEGFTCLCREGYAGEFCENAINSCAGNPCLNDGQCVYEHDCVCVVYPEIVLNCTKNAFCERTNCPPACRLRFSGEPSYQCVCSPNFEGSDCQSDVNECTRDPAVCQNGGQCTNQFGSYFCDCSGTGFHGTNCDEETDECLEQEDLCVHGTCSNTHGSFQCICDVGYSGDNCELNVNECTAESCLHNGTCIDEVGGHRCNCTGTGYEGESCNLNIDECETNRHECLNGGECVDKLGSYSCICTADYTGDFCEIAVDAGISTTIIVIVVLILLIVLVILLLCCLWYIKDSRKQKGKYKPSIAEMQVGTPLSNILDADTEERLV